MCWWRRRAHLAAQDFGWEDQMVEAAGIEPCCGKNLNLELMATFGLTESALTIAPILGTFEPNCGAWRINRGT
jgi:hypothetical protein